MKISFLHHVSLATADAARSTRFYQDVFGAELIARPPFSFNGAWFGLGPTQIHLVENASGTMRASPRINTSDTHFAIRVEDFDAALRHLAARGFREDAGVDDPMRMLVIRDSIAGFPQAFLLDPDRHVVEINAAA